MQWENRNDKRIENNIINSRISNALVSCEFALEERKQKFLKRDIFYIFNY